MSNAINWVYLFHYFLDLFCLDLNIALRNGWIADATTKIIQVNLQAPVKKLINKYMAAIIVQNDPMIAPYTDDSNFFSFLEYSFSCNKHLNDDTVNPFTIKIKHAEATIISIKHIDKIV